MSTAETTRQLVIFSLGTEEYALPITRVQEIIRYTEPRVVASRTAWIRGVINLRGKIVPVCDLAERLGLELERSPVAKIVIVETQTGTAGVIVDLTPGRYVYACPVAQGSVDGEEGTGPPHFTMGMAGEFTVR